MQTGGWRDGVEGRANKEREAHVCDFRLLPGVYCQSISMLSGKTPGSDLF